MKVTARYVGSVLLASVLVAWALLFDRLEPLLGSAVIFGWLLSVQFSFTQNVLAADRSLGLVSTVDSTVQTVGQTASQTVFRDRATELPSDIVVSIEQQSPIGASGASPEPVSIDALPATMSYTWTTSGTFTVPAPEVHLASISGLVTETIVRGEESKVRVRPQLPRRLQIGAGGSRGVSAYGEHQSSTASGGTVPAELREYGPEEDAGKIEWNATARLGTPYVREFEGETDRETFLIVDQRSSLAVGAPGETMADYARHYGLLVAGKAAENGDPTRCSVLRDDGIESVSASAVAKQGYQAIEDLLSTSTRHTAGRRPQNESITAADARHRARQLVDDESRFSQTLRPFFERPEQYIERVSDRPLFETVRRGLGTATGGFTVIVTDDTDRVTLRESVSLAAQNDNHVLVALTPRSVFTPDDDPTTSQYERYVDFETFRRRIAGMERVEAITLTPGDTLSALTERGRRERESQRREVKQ